MGLYQDDYDFTRLIVAGDQVRLPFRDTPIVFSPSHSICLTTNSTRISVLTEMINIGYEKSASHRTFSQQLWTLTEYGEWITWSPDEEEESFSVVELQKARETVQCYEETKGIFEKILDKDIFVGTFQTFEIEEKLSSYCIYTIDLPSYLPKTDFVVIIDSELPEGESVLGKLKWNQFVESLGLGSLELIKEISPKWYRLIRPLSKEQKFNVCEKVEPLT